VQLDLKMNYFKKRVRLELDLQFYKHDLDNTSYKETEITDLIEEVLNGTFDRHLLAERYCGPFYVEHIHVHDVPPEDQEWEEVKTIDYFY
jgi:hypothetical protein